MIPQGVDVPALEKDLQDDGVAIGELGTTYPGLTQALADVVKYSREKGYGNVCIVHVDPAPTKVADHRDVAEMILRDTPCETVIARSAVGGDVVSSKYSRKAIEAHQFDMIGQQDYVVSASEFMDSVAEDTTPWAIINIATAIILAVAVIACLVSFTRRRDIQPAKTT